MPFMTGNAGDADVVAVFGADLSGFEKGTRDVQAGIDKLASGMTRKLSGIGNTLSAALTVPILGLGAALLKVGMEFDDAFDRITVGTGATGAALEGLEQSFRNVFKDVPVSAEKVSIAITELNRRLGLTGEGLETLTKQEVELARMTGGDLKAQIEATSKVFENWKGAIQDPTTAMDTLFKVGQITGIGVTDLATQMTKAGAPLRALGLGFDQAALLVAQFDKTGVDAGKTTQALSRALSEMAKKGVTDPQQAFKLLIDKIKNSTSEMGALEIATKVFGQRAGVQMVDAIKAGKFSLDDLAKKLAENQDSVLEAAKRTKDFTEQLIEFAHGVMIAVEPLANDLFKALNDLTPEITRVINAVTSLVKWFRDLPGPVKTAIEVLIGVAAVSGPITKMSGIVIGALGGIKTAFNVAREAAMAFRAAALAGLAGGGGAAGLGGVAGVAGAAGGLAFLAGSAQWEKAKAEFEANTKEITEKYSRFGGKLADMTAAVPDLVGVATAKANTYLSEQFKSIEKKLESGVQVTKKLADENAPNLDKLLGGGGKGIAEAASKMKALLDLQLKQVNDYVQHLGNAGQVTERVWTALSGSEQRNLLTLSTGYRDLTAAMELWAVKSIAAHDKALRPEAFDKLIAKVKESRDTIVATTTVIDTSLHDFGLSVDVFVDQTLANWDKIAAGQLKGIADAQKYHDSLLDQFQDLSRQLPDSWNLIIDGIVNASGRAGDAVLELANKIKGWAGDIIGVVGTLPGHFGDAARGVIKTVDQWVVFADKVLAVLHRLNITAVGSVGELVEKILGMFKGLSGNIGSIMGGLGGIVGGVGTFVGTRHQGLATGVLGGAASGFMTGAGIGLMIGGPFAPVLAPVTGAIGAIVGGIAGLFGHGKSDAQKKQEEDAKKAAEINTASAMANLTQGIMEGLEKGRQFLENLETFTAVPKQALKKFFKQMETVLTSFIEMAGQFKTDAMQKAKEVTDLLGPVFEFLGNAVNFTKIAREIEEVTDESLAKLFSAITRLEAGMETLTAKLEMSVVKRTAKMAEKLTAVFAFISIIPDALKKVNETPDVTDEILASIFASATKIIDKFAELIDQFEAYSFNKLAKSSKQFQGVFEAVAAIVGSLTAIGQYQPIEDAALNAVTADFQKVQDAISGWIDLGQAALEKALNLEDVVRRLRESLSRSLGGLSAAVSAMSGGSTASLRSQSTSIDNRNYSVVNVGGVAVSAGDPRYTQVAEAVRNLERVLGGVQVLSRTG